MLSRSDAHECYLVVLLDVEHLAVRRKLITVGVGFVGIILIELVDVSVGVARRVHLSILVPKLHDSLDSQVVVKSHGCVGLG